MRLITRPLLNRKYIFPLFNEELAKCGLLYYFQVCTCDYMIESFLEKDTYTDRTHGVLCYSGWRFKKKNSIMNPR